MYERFKIKRDSQTWADEGPDLLRQILNARQRARNIMAERLEGWSFRIIRGDDRSDESDRMGKGALLNEYEQWMRQLEGAEGFVALHRGDPAFQSQREKVRRLDTVNCSPGVVELRSLVEHAYPPIIFAGGYVWKETSPGSWSDHAWGTAFDETENENAGVHNAEVSSWLARMGRAGCTRFDYALGSRDGRVVQFGAPDYDMEPSGADRNHLWHNHVSVLDHDGSKPPRQGGVW